MLKSVDKDLFTCEEYTVPEGVEVMEYDSFYGQSKLRRIHLPSALREIGDNMFIHCPIESIEIPLGVTEIKASMCECCKELESVDIPNTIKAIRIGAFNGCSKLKAIELPESIERIDDNAFAGCLSLKHIKLPSELRWLAPSILQFSGIESIEIGENIHEIGYCAFYGCEHLKSLVIPEHVKDIGWGIVTAHEGFEGIVCNAPGYHVENDALIDDKSGEMLCCWTTQKDYVVPECVKRIADFSMNDYVETITVKQYVEIMDSDTFAGNSNLKKTDFLGGYGAYPESGNSSSDWFPMKI